MSATRPLPLFLLLAAALSCRAPTAPVVLLTDFGLESDAVGLVRGAVLRVAPDATLVDLTHQVPPYDVRAGALLLRDAPATFPPGSVFVAVVDPGVGTRRRVLAARLGDGTLLVAPDNGLLTAVLLDHPEAEVRAVENQRLFLPRTSETFHGRDVFAPVGAHLARGFPFERVGPVVRDWARLDLPAPRREGAVLLGTVERIDLPFGNVWTDVPAKWAPRPPAKATVLLRGRRITVPLVRTFAEVPRGAALLYENSRGRLALALREGDMARRFGVRAGDAVRIEIVR